MVFHYGSPSSQRPTHSVQKDSLSPSYEPRLMLLFALIYDVMPNTVLGMCGTKEIN